MFVGDVEYSEIIGLRTKDVFIAETVSYLPEVIQDKTVLCDSTKFVIGTNGASTELYNKLADAHSCSSFVVYKGLPKTDESIQAIPNP